MRLLNYHYTYIDVYICEKRGSEIGSRSRWQIQ